jgi:hypothetical protein
MNLLSAICAITVVGLVTMPALAADQPAPGGAGGGCQQDIETFCKGVEKGEGRIRACLKQHRHELSPNCKAAIKAARAQHAQQAGSGSTSGSAKPPGT